ncbi:MAG: GDSL-type esterase/lipase family protein [Thermoanaerobaculia bacterium]|nr:GDSL-type esterase/lipase family protein [Thermoanaerobaculia bacterium]
MAVLVAVSIASVESEIEYREDAPALAAAAIASDVMMSDVAPGSGRDPEIIRRQAGIEGGDPPGGRVRVVAVNVGLLLGSVSLFLLVGELTLRFSGFSYVLYPEEIEFGEPNPVAIEMGFREDPELFWTPKRYEETLERLRAETPPLLLLGDSCTYFGHYDEALARLARERLDVGLEWGNLSVPGWSSYQGLQQLRRDVPPLEPAVLTVYFGWNDHWIGFGIEDKNVARVKRVFGSRLGRLRVVQLGTKAMVAWGARKTAYPERVSLADFRSNLRDMVGLIHDEGAVPVLLTAPAGHRSGDELPGLENRWLRDRADLVPLHQAYAQAVRDVAQAEGERTRLCDLAARAEDFPWDRRKALFTGDGIHLSDVGDQTVARWLFECFERDGLWALLGTRSQGEHFQEGR